MSDNAPPPATEADALPAGTPPVPAENRPRIAITYCTQCNWLLRAGWMAQELLSTFRDAIGEVALIPGSGGAFAITCGDALIWERRRDGGFPDIKALKQRVRDRIEPGRDLGHVDRASRDGASRDEASRDPASRQGPTP